MTVDQQRQEKLREICNNQIDICADVNCLGAWIYLEGGRMKGGTEGGFHWFTKRSTFEEYARHIGYFFPSRNPAENEERWHAINGVVNRWANGQISLPAARIELNRFLKGVLVVEWWGMLGELMESDTPFPAEIRAAYWSELNGTDVEDDSRPIPTESLEKFSEWVFSYPI